MSTIRLVLINTKELTYAVYEGRKEIAVWKVDNNIPLTAEEVEQIRTEEYKQA